MQDINERKFIMDQENLVVSDWLKQALKGNELSHPALKRLKEKIVNQSNFQTNYSRSYSRSCFPSGTKVLLSNMTTKDIEHLAVGDVVMSFDGLNQVPSIVEDIESPLRDHFYILSFADGSTLHLTQEHPIYTKKGWRSISPTSTSEENEHLLVGKLEIGDSVLSITGVYQKLVSIEFVPGQIQTYNINKLSRNDNFFVNGFLAHNKAQLALCGKCAPGYADFWCRVNNPGCKVKDLTLLDRLNEKKSTSI